VERRLTLDVYYCGCEVLSRVTQRAVFHFQYNHVTGSADDGRQTRLPDDLQSLVGVV